MTNRLPRQTMGGFFILFGLAIMMFTEYDDGVTRRLVERVTVVDTETIRVKLRDSEVEIEQKLF